MRILEKFGFLRGFLFVVLGILLFIFGQKTVEALYLHISSIIFFLGIKYVIDFFRKKDSTKKILYTGLIFIFLGFFWSNNYGLATFLTIIVIAINQIFLGVVRLFNFYLQLKDKVNVSKIFFFRGIFHLYIGQSALFNLKNYYDFSTYNRLGIYLILLGGMYVVDFMKRFEKYRVSIKRRFRVPVPVVFSALFTAYSLREDNSEGEYYSEEFLEKKREATIDKTVDLEVWVHTAEKGASVPGHVDISYRGKTYSYGHYDEDSHSLFGSKGDGVLYIVNSEDYGVWLQEKHNYKGVYRYGINLNAQQRLIVEQKISEIMSSVYEYNFTTDTQKASYLGQLAQDIPTKIYKFHKSRFKTYFVLTTNCVLLADTIVGSTGFDLISVAGITSPGAYKLYLDKEYDKIYSNVITRTLYRNSTR